MAGTVEGGKLAAEKNMKRFGPDFYAKIGAKGGARKGVVKGFAADRDRARWAGAKGGAKSRRGKADDGTKIS